MTTSDLGRNLARVRERIDAACARAGRSANDVRLVAVTKSASVERIRELLALGVHHLGENRPQQLLERAAQLPPDASWHLIGNLQRNKARRVLPLIECVHSVDSFRLLAALDRLAEELGIAPRVLLQVNVSGEGTKQGFAPEELLRPGPESESAFACRRLRIEGLMTMAPYSDDPEASRPVFRALRELRDRLAEASAGRWRLEELSMGMSGDFEPAIEEGATLVRIGSALFEE